jgi:broad specificity phosphatase PhoE
MTEREIWWVRHGPTHAKTMVGWSDLPADLSDRAAIERLQAYLPADAPVVSSDLSRAVATADAIQEGRPRLGHVEGLREMHFGAWELRGHAEIEAEDPERIRAFWDQPGEVRPPGGESWNMLSARVTAAVERLPKTPRLIAVAHFGVILCEVQRTMGWTAERVFGERIDNLSVTRIVYGAGAAVDPINHRP